MPQCMMRGWTLLGGKYSDLGRSMNCVRTLPQLIFKAAFLLLFLGLPRYTIEFLIFHLLVLEGCQLRHHRSSKDIISRKKKPALQPQAQPVSSRKHWNGDFAPKAKVLLFWTSNEQIKATGEILFAISVTNKRIKWLTRVQSRRSDMFHESRIFTKQSCLVLI